MKVESSPDVQTVQPLDQPAVSPASTPAPASGMDELAHLFNLEVQNNSQPLSQRMMSVRVPPAEQLAQIYDQLGHPAQATLASLSRRIRWQLLQHPHVDKLLELAGGDPARAFVVLKYVATQADVEIRPSEAALARDAIAKLEVRFKGEIQAGLNIAVALQAAGTDPQERQALRTLYYASVVARQSLATMMQALLGVYGEERLADGLKMMRKALADDIAAKVSSLPTPLLRTLLLGLQSCGQLSGVLAGCNALMQRLGIDHDAVSLLQRLLGYAGAGIAAAEILRLGSDLSGSSNAQQLLALNALYPVVQQLPLAIWLDGRVREETLRGFLAVIGELDRVTRGPARFPGELGVMA
ncbi:type III secretion system gatekeeper subunit SctW [Pseudomonas sp. GXZC]|uniref:type III secretion system gatekeeper subunit SctW n=1 Tax=Pseudomonas sp. GXZC TaxID=3003351 RepID=UPI0010550D5D|nr:type III secretion system gatekeeper subunit SctW [Pseudomonas sp. GXZC]WAT29560.1 type III secretion system gatekeeper subunit SctW [Pseudomonas sp. GXZC]